MDHKAEKEEQSGCCSLQHLGVSSGPSYPDGHTVGTGWLASSSTPHVSEVFEFVKKEKSWCWTQEDVLWTRECGSGALRSSTELRSVTHGRPLSPLTISRFSTWNLLSKTDLKYIVGSIPDYCYKMNIAIKKVALFFWFPSAYKSYIPMLEKMWRKGNHSTLLVGM